jgi:heme exporter protein D
MGATAHINFIAASYASAVIVVGALIAWVTLDYHAQRRTLAELETQGVARRSATPAERAIAQATESAREKA